MNWSVPVQVILSRSQPHSVCVCECRCQSASVLLHLSGLPGSRPVLLRPQVSVLPLQLVPQRLCAGKNPPSLLLCSVPDMQPSGKHQVFLLCVRRFQTKTFVVCVSASSSQRRPVLLQMYALQQQRQVPGGDAADGNIHSREVTRGLTAHVVSVVSRFHP